MASGQIRMTPETMRSRANEYRTQGEKVNEVIDSMDTLLNTLLDEWEGSAAAAYKEKFDELRPGFIKARDLIGDIADSLDKTATAIEQTDENIANAYRS